MRKSTSNSSLVDRLTNEVQNGTALARPHDALARPTGYRLMRNGGASLPGEPLAVSYAYDALGRLAAVDLNAETQSRRGFEYQYLAGSDLVSGYVASAGDSGGVASRPLLVRSVAYERRRDLVSAVANSFDLSTFQPSNLSTFANANDAAGRRVEVTRTGAAFGALAGATDAYGYNGRSEVVSSRRTLGGGEVRGFGYDYAYDPIGNRTSATYYDEQGEAVASAYTANALNQYTSRTVPGNVQVRGEADTGAVVTVNENPASLIESGDLASSFTHRFSTKPWCPVTGLCEYQMRKYRPEIGR